jgi:hypothetical protein
MWSGGYTLDTPAENIPFSEIRTAMFRWHASQHAAYNNNCYGIDNDKALLIIRMLGTGNDVELMLFCNYVFISHALWKNAVSEMFLEDYKWRRNGGPPLYVDRESLRLILVQYCKDEAKDWLVTRRKHGEYPTYRITSL